MPDVTLNYPEGADPQTYQLSSALTYYWDVGTLSWIKGQQAGGGGVAATIADGGDVAEGATTDNAVVTDTTGTVSGKLRGLVKWAYERMPAALGQTTMASSLPVTLASNQGALGVTGTFFQATQPVSGPLTDAQLRAVAVPVSGTVVANPTSFGTNLDEASATITYVGNANPGTATSSASWSIKRLDSTAGLIVLWADGNANFDNVWDSRAGLSYS